MLPQIHSDLQQDEWDEEGAVRNATILDGCIVNPTRFAVLIFNVATDTHVEKMKELLW
jgi:hypothetical protein